ncbi:outer membrane lipoprotein-sorting protein [Spectribacter hydrogenoxidans]|uniref:Outer membrane lipoprotein-sorting protein n=1 Tax=Spectribacter hydrogenoxidans TaxID=3075608 RepID=A0ABU3C022_9GAMM|nr:outer membrane lipoprotein-sorting protein [Salinisphaera sp. W335]MDT0634905.1 outer membrane lipoprotein-sorting protein [Salinisphaera sp. W335]
MTRLVSLLLAGLAAGVSTSSPAAPDPEAVRACSRANLPDRTMVQDLTLDSTDRAGNRRQIEATFFVKRFEKENRANLVVRAPIDLSGVSYLMVDTPESDRLFLYLPSIQKVRRVSGKTATESLLGTDFSYEDMKQLRSISEGGTLVGEGVGEIEGRIVDIVALTPPAGDESAYERLVFRVDRETCVTLRVDFFERGAELTKRYTADPSSLRQVGQRWLATRSTMTDRQDGTETQLEVTSVEYDEDVSDGVFNSRTFYLGVYDPDAARRRDAG